MGYIETHGPAATLVLRLEGPALRPLQIEPSELRAAYTARVAFLRSPMFTTHRVVAESLAIARSFSATHQSWVSTPTRAFAAASVDTEGPTSLPASGERDAPAVPSLRGSGRGAPSDRPSCARRTGPHVRTRARLVRVDMNVIVQCFSPLLMSPQHQAWVSPGGLGVA